MKPSSKAVMIGCISFFVFLYGNLLFGGLVGSLIHGGDDFINSSLYSSHTVNLSHYFLHILDSQKNQSAFRQNGRKINLCFANRN